MKNVTQMIEPELSRPLRADKVSMNGVEEKIVASPKEREALAKRFSLVEMRQLEAKLKVIPKQLGIDFEVTGEFTADVTQRCVVTLEPLPVTLQQPIHVHYVAASLMSAEGEHSPDEDDIELIDGGIMDLGELVAQHFGLALDLYPRKEGLPPVEAEFGEKIVPVSPFAQLVRSKDKTPKE
jgi:uncharacterized metal-binding protein YceD (DUF177 family)